MYRGVDVFHLVFTSPSKGLNRSYWYPGTRYNPANALFALDYEKAFNSSKTPPTWSSLAAESNSVREANQ